MTAADGLVLAPATVGDARALARLHALSFPGEAWSKAAFEHFLATPGIGGLIATGPLGPRGFILVRRAADEAEVLTLAVHRKTRRQGVAGRLLRSMLTNLQASPVTVLHLEVAADNEAAIALYQKADFARCGLRKGYYARASGAVDAVLMKRPLQA